MLELYNKVVYPIFKWVLKNVVDKSPQSSYQMSPSQVQISQSL